MVTFFTLQPLSSQTQSCTTLWLFRWQMFTWVLFFSSLFQTFTARTHRGKTSSSLLRFKYKKEVLIKQPFSKNCCFVDRENHTSVLISSSQGSIVVYPPYPHNHHFHLYHTHHSSFWLYSIWMALKICTEWNLVKKKSLKKRFHWISFKIVKIS